MLETLNEEQIILMEKVKKEWLDKIFTTPLKLNKRKARSLIGWLYEFSKLEKPKIIFVDSPLAIQYACNMLKGQVYDQVSDQVSNQVRGQVRGQVYGQVSDQVSNQVRGQVSNQVRDQVSDQVYDQVSDQKFEFFSFSSYGAVDDYGWLAFYDFFERLGIVKLKDFDKFRDLMNCGIYDMVQLKNYCVVCGLPEYILRDTNNNLHSLKGSAIKWKDGFELYYINGVNFKKELWDKVVRRELSATEILKLENMEQRYIALKIYGAESLLKELKATLIDKSEKGNELYALDKIIPNKSLRLLKYSCPSTGRVYTKFVPFEFNKADEAQAWSFSIQLKDYLSLNLES